MFAERVANGKYLRDLPYSKRFLLYHGEDEEYFKYTLQYREKWQDKLFYVSENDTPSDSFRREWPTVESLKLQDIEVDDAEHSQLPNAINDIRIFNANSPKAQTMILTTESGVSLAQQTQRNCLAIDCGGPIASLKWLVNQQSASPFQYLAISVILSDTESAINLPILSLFHQGDCSELKSAIKIFEYNTSTDKLTLKKTLLTTTMGPSHNLNWIPVHSMTDVDTIGVLTGSFSDGKFHLLKVTEDLLQNNGSSTLEVTKSSLSYELKTRITCYDFLDVGKVIVGLADGSIAEFVFPWFDDGTDFTIPSFINRIAETSITTVTVADQGTNKYVFANTTGTLSFAFEYFTYSLDRVDMTTNLSMVSYVYNSVLRVCVGVFGDFVGSFFPRVPLESPNQLLRMSGNITALGASKWLSHPLLLAGNSLGEMFILNFARKLLNGNKTTNKSSIPLRLWKIDIDSTLRQLVLNTDYLNTLPDEASVVALAPTGITILSLEWNENVIGSSIYAMGTLGGLLIVERVDPEV